MASRRRLNVVSDAYHPAYVVWELTLRCDQRCTHCGSRAADARPSELSLEQALDVARQLAALGAREVVLIGGEAYLHHAFLPVVRELVAHGVQPVMTTGGRGITPQLAQEMKSAGMARVSVSVDGVGRTHDLMRATPGSFQSAMDALQHLSQAGIPVASNINLNRFNMGDLEPLYPLLRDAGVRSWQFQLTAPLGRAADRPDMLLQPYDLLELMPRLAALKRRAFQDGVVMMPGNNVGYFGPEEALLRSPTVDGQDHWQGCQAGRFVMGVESDGAVKGCPSLQTAHYVGGNVLTQPLRQVWEESPVMAFRRGEVELWGFCASCPFANPCRGGCTFTAEAIMGRPGNNPYCHYRARTFAAAGQRERLVPKERAPGTPFDNGRLEIVVEALDVPEPQQPTQQQRLRVWQG